MLIKDSYDDAINISEETNLFLFEYTIAPSPANYSVIYLYVSKRNREITELIDKKLKNNETLDPEFMDQLFYNFVSSSKNIEKVILTPFEKILSKSIATIESQVANEKLTQLNLKKADNVLAQGEHSKSLQQVVKFLITTIEKSKHQHQSLTNDLTKTSKEVQQLKVKLEESRNEALLDALTGLWNRRGCEEKLKAVGLENTHASFIIDIDNFKKVNDQFGHYIGDNVIKRVAKSIKDNINEQDIAVRYGGEEFVVVMLNKTKNEAHATAEKIRLTINKLKLVQRESNTTLPPISVSIGITQVANDSHWLSVFQRADIALYQAKNSGRNRCVFG
ncbi:MAG: diguanylate cyclase [Alteromonadaceae bacterium]|jgi:diguanylate cyclase